MKIALCLSGQPRSFEKGYEYHKKNLLDHYDVDVFIHSWMYPEDLLDKIEDLYKPADMNYELPLNEEYFKKYNVANHQYPAYNTTQMFYGVFMSNHICKKYAQTLNIKYDVVIRSRFDFAINVKLNYEEVQANLIYVPNCRQNPEHTVANDQYAYGTPEVMNLYAQTYNNIDFLHSQGCPYNGEELMCANLHAYDLVGNNLVYVDVNHPFSPDKYGSMRHSLIRDDFSAWNKLRG
jgi:hypothetical protein